MAAVHFSTLACGALHSPYVNNAHNNMQRNYKNFKPSIYSSSTSSARTNFSKLIWLSPHLFSLRIAGKGTSRHFFPTEDFKNLFFLFCFSSKQLWLGNAATVRFHIKQWAAPRTVQLVHSKNKSWMSVTQGAKCTTATESIGRTGIITCQHLLADARRLSRLKATLCLACSSTVGDSRLVNIPRGGGKPYIKRTGRRVLVENFETDF